jgi:hypothetical protein
MQLYNSHSIKRMVVTFVLFAVAVFVAGGAVKYFLWTQREQCKTDLYLQAVSFEKDEKIAAAKRIYEYLCEGAFFLDTTKSEHPCDASARVNKRLNDALGEALEVVARYRVRENKYPNTLAVVLHELRPSNQKIAQQFILCRKIPVGGDGYTCAGELEAYSGADISIRTGWESFATFDLNPQVKNSKKCS